MPGHNYKLFTLCSLLFNLFAAIAQLVERWLPKPKVAGSSPVYRSLYSNSYKGIAFR